MARRPLPAASRAPPPPPPVLAHIAPIIAAQPPADASTDILPTCHFTNIDPRQILFTRMKKEVSTAKARFAASLPDGVSVVVSAIFPAHGCHLVQPNTFGGKRMPGAFMVGLADQPVPKAKAEAYRQQFKQWVAALEDHVTETVTASMPRAYAGVQKPLFHPDFMQPALRVMEFDCDADLSKGGHRVAVCEFKDGMIAAHAEDIEDCDLISVCFRPGRIIVKDADYRLTMEVLSVHFYGKMAQIAVDYSRVGTDCDLSAMLAPSQQMDESQ